VSAKPEISILSPNRDDEPAMELIVKRDGQTVERHRLRHERTTIGRNAGSVLCIPNQYVSSKHAMIDFDHNGPFIVDLCSMNKTYVNDVAIERSALKHGDVISIGVHKIHFSVSGPNTKAKHSNAIDTSPDGFRAFADALHEDEDLLAAEIDTVNLDEREWLVADSVPDMPDAGVGFGHGIFDQAEVEAAIVEATGDPREILNLLHERYGHDEDRLTSILGTIFDYRTIGSHELMCLTPDFRSLDLAQARERQCVLVFESNIPTIVISNPFDQDLRPWIESRLPYALRWLLVSPGNMNAYIARQERSTRAMDSAIQATGVSSNDGSEVENLSLASISHDSSPVVKLVHSTLYDALRAGASDIHMESGSGALEIRYRIDGVLAHIATVNGTDTAEQVISRIKVMSELDIAERRTPQDGRFKTAYDGRPIDFRVSIMPSSFGEDAVLRVLDKQAVTDQMTELSLDSLGFDAAIVKALRKLSERPYGMLLVTGPTGSGKTTTLYGAISETNSGLGKIVTIEDPVEYQLPGVLQIPVNEKKGLTFARGLRSILRHDPDKIMVGEIRDPETAQIAIQSALTGHLVFTTVHANNVFDVLSRFLHMGVDAYSFVSALNGILAQRLLRIICQNCGEKIEPSKEMLESTGEPLDIAQGFNWRAGHGCSECRGTGYRGRRAIGELLVLNDELREAIINREPARKLKELARASGVQFIRTAALELVRDGQTTMEEVDRVTTMA
jgi:general secretion pathway protein E